MLYLKPLKKDLETFIYLKLSLIGIYDKIFPIIL